MEEKTQKESVSDICLIIMNAARIGQGALQNSFLISGTGAWHEFGPRKANALLNPGGAKTDKREEYPPVTSYTTPTLALGVGGVQN